MSARAEPPHFTQVRAKTAPAYASPVTAVLPDAPARPQNPPRKYSGNYSPLPPDVETVRARTSGAFVLAVVAVAITLTALGTLVWVGLGWYAMATRPYDDCVVGPERPCTVVTDRDGLVIGENVKMNGYVTYTLSTMTPAPRATPKARRP